MICPASNSNYNKLLVKSFKNSKDINFVVVDSDGTIIEISDGARNILDLPKKNSSKKLNINHYFSENPLTNAFHDMSQPDTLEYTVQLSLKSGSSPLKINVSKLLVEKEPLFLLLIKEIGIDSALETGDDCRLKSLEILNDLVRDRFKLPDDPEPLFKSLKRNNNSDYACLMLLDGYNLIIKPSKEFKKNYEIPECIAIDGDKGLDNLLNTQSLLIIKDDTSKFSVMNSFNLPDIKQVTIVPIILKDSFFGFILLLNKNYKSYSEEQEILLSLYASISAQLLMNVETMNLLKLQLETYRQNIIERSKSISDLKEQNEQILEAEKIKNEFIAHMSHELRTPLNAILGFAEAMKLQLFGQLNVKQEEYIMDIHASAVHLLGMINDILDLSKIESKKMKLSYRKFSVELATNEVINISLALTNDKNLTIEEDFRHSCDEIYADTRKYQQILFNLLSNAIKFSKPGGTIKIITEDDQIEDRPALKLKVVDQGIGISKKDLGNIFKKFYQAENKFTKTHPGTGLGLTITKELVEMHHGKIVINTKPNRGSEFIILLPIEPIIVEDSV